MSQTPAISVCMPVFNAERYLAQTIESVLGQTFGDFEFVIIDDGSTDSTPAILKRFAGLDRRLRLITRPNKGLTKSLNECLRESKGQFIARIDADDLCKPDRFRLQADFLNAHADVVLLGGAYELIDAEGRLLRIEHQPADDATLQDICLSGRTPIAHPVAMFRREAALQVGGYDETMLVAQDLDLWLRLGEVGKLACLPEVLIQYRLHDTSVSEKKQAMQVNNMRLACERAWKRRGLSDRTFLGERGWRASSERASRAAYAAKYGWWAFNSGQRRTALHYGWRAVKTQPLGAEGWRLLVCAMMKKAPVPSPSGRGLA